MKSLSWLDNKQRKSQASTLIGREPQSKNRDGIKGLQLRRCGTLRCGKLNSTHHGKLQRRSVLCTAALQYTNRSTRYTYPSFTVVCLLQQLCIWLLWPQYTSRSTWGIKNYLVYCSSSTAAAAIHKVPQYMRYYLVFFSVLRCRSTWDTAAPQLAAPVADPVRSVLQFESFYTVPN